MSIRISVEGEDKLIEEIRRTWGRRYPVELAKALKLEAEAIMTAAKLEVPVDTGVLRSSGIVLDPELTSDRVTVVLGFGGAAKEYAVYVHEDLEKNHPVGKAKFLEDPVKRAADGFNQRVAKKLAAVK